MFVARARKKDKKDEDSLTDNLRKKSKHAVVRKIDKFNDPAAHTNAAVKAFLRGCQLFQNLSTNGWFGGFITLCICMAGVLVGIQTYDSMEEDPTLKGLDLFILVSLQTRPLRRPRTSPPA